MRCESTAWIIAPACIVSMAVAIGRSQENSSPNVQAPSTTPSPVVPAPPAAPNSPSATESPVPVTPPAPASPVKASREELEKRFQDLLSGATFRGTWQMTEGGAADSALSEPRPDSYTIVSATKVRDDYWVIRARIQYADKDVTIPVPVRVVWAEDTPVIRLDDLALPMLGTYSARVMVYHGFYCGTWYCGGKNYGGIMSGRVVKEMETSRPAGATGGQVPAPGSPPPVEAGKPVERDR